ncbi:chromatin assembly factor 1 subunit B-like protein [Leptotrombidium deliense]|uniref:Chromatin assembly factor 1 subunit B-like protein n=1 Tax=Leptotrombidium deliense TaxID=299467 RepID=A0A443SMT5_9ACAR|nr:chromatin assembly factor 1 subunit B-like protein [Leptotrombidium deliense]
MKTETPQISWHNREPVLSVDIQFYDKDSDQSRLRYRIATASVDHHVLIWLLTRSALSSNVETEILADLNRHSKPVNIVRFSPSYGYLASGDNEGTIIVWKLQEHVELENKEIGNSSAEEAMDDYGIVNKEHWIQYKTLRGHLEDVVDLSWNIDGHHLVSGSVDNQAIVWEVAKAKRTHSLDGHKSYVQGVATDPLNNFTVTLSADRNMRVYSNATKRTLYRVYKGNIKVDEEYKASRLFYDDTLRSYSRRICFSPGGECFLATSGIVEIDSDDKEVKFVNCCYLFLRNCLNKPAAYYSTGNKYNNAVSCCPTIFQLRENVANPFPIVFAVATQDSVLFFDTQQDIPFAMVSDIHYTSLSDIKWSPDGSLLLISSTDGYCTFITFDENEIGCKYDGPLYSFESTNISSPKVVESTKVCSTPENTNVKKTPESAKITNFFSKVVARNSKENTSDTNCQSGCKRKVVIELSDDETNGNTPKKKHPLPTANLNTLFVPMKKDINTEILPKVKENNGIMDVKQPIQVVQANNSNGVENKPDLDVKLPVDSNAKKPRRVGFITLTTPK